MENVYALRANAPTLSLLCATIIFCLSPRPRFAVRLLMMSLIGVSVVGAFLSGGRIAVLIIPLYLLVILIWRRKFGFLLAIGGACACAIVLLNIFSDPIERHAPPVILRSTYFFMIKKDARSANSVESSTEWREELIARAFQEWMHTRWTIVFGRSIKPFNFNYDAALAGGAGSESMEASIERGHTHCLVTDLLLPYGLIGALLYIAVQIASIAALVRFVRHHSVHHRLHSFAFFLVILYTYSLLYGLVAGGYDFFPQWLFLCFLTFLAAPTPDSTDPHDLHRHPQLSPT